MMSDESASTKDNAPQEPEITVTIIANHQLGATSPGGETSSSIVLSGSTSSAASATGSSKVQFGGYELLEKIAQGGMGAVYKARQLGLDRLVALKMTLAGHFASQDERRRFLAEAQAAGKLDHPHIVPVYEVGEQAGQPYFSMGYVEGTTLKALISEGPLSAGRAAELMKTVAEAVAYANSQGVIHRDLKPANVLIDLSGHPRVTDFGLAKRISEDCGLTQSGQILGTPSFMPPEQALGQGERIGIRSDVYSLGATLYALLTGRAPFQAATSIETLKQVIDQEPVPPRQLNPEVPPDLETLCLKCLQKEPEKRYDSSDALALDLGRFLRNEPILARPVSRRERAWRWCRRNPVIASLSMGMAVTLLLGSAISSILAVQYAQARQVAVDEKNNVQKAHEKSEVAHHALELQATLDRLEQGKLLEAEVQFRKVPWNRRRWEYEFVLNRINQANQQRPAAHHPILRVAYSPVGDRIAVAGGTKNDGRRSVPIAYFCAASSEGDRTNLVGHDSVVASIAFDPTGQRLLTASWDHSARIWDLPAGRERGKLTGHTGWVSDATFSPDGKHVATASWDNTIRLWDAGSLTEVNCFRHSSPVIRLAFRPGTNQIAGGCHDGTVALWDIEAKRVKETLTGHSRMILSLAFHPDGHSLLSVEEGSRARLWNLKQNTSTVISLPFRLGTSAAYSPDGRVLAIGGEGILLWDVAEAKTIKKLALGAGIIESIAFSADGRHILAGDQKGRLRAVAVDLDDSLTTVTNAETWASCVAMAPDGDRGAIGYEDGTFTIIDPQSGRSIQSGRADSSAILSASFDHTGRRLALGSANGSVTVFDVSAGKTVASWTLTIAVGGNEIRGQVSDLVIAPDGDQFAAVLWEADPRSVREGRSWMGVWRLSDGKKLHFFSGYGAPMGDTKFLPEHPRSVQFSPDGQSVAAGVGHYVYFWNPRNGEFRFKTVSTGSTVHALSFSPDSGGLAQSRGASAEGRSDQVALLKIPRALTPGIALEHRKMTGHAGVVQSIAFHPEGDRLATAGADGTVKLWDTATGEQVLQLSTRPFGVRCLRWSRDGRRLTCTQHGSGTMERPPFRLRAFRSEPGQIISSLPAGRARILELKISADNRRMAYVDNDGFVCVHDLGSGHRTLDLRFDAKEIKLAIAPAGQSLAVSTAVNTVQLYDVDKGAAFRTLNLSGKVRELVFDPSGNFLVAAVQSGARRKAGESGQSEFGIWDIRDGSLIRTWGPAAEGMAAAHHAAYRPDGSLLALADGKIALVAAPLTAGDVHWLELPWKVASFSLSADGSQLAARAEQASNLPSTENLKVFNFSERHWRDLQHQPVRGASDSPWPLPSIGAGSRWATLEFENDNLAIRELESGREPWRLPIFPFRGSNELAQFSRDGSVLVVADMAGPTTRDGNLSSWGPDVDLWTWDVGNSETLRFLAGEHERDIRSVAFNDSGSCLASVGFDRKLVVNNLDDGSNRAFRQYPMDGLAYDPIGSRFAIRAANDRILILPDRELSDDDRPQQIHGEVSGGFSTYEWNTGGSYPGQTSLGFSPDGRQLAFGSKKNILIIDPGKGAVLQTIEGHRGEVEAVVFHPDGQFVFSTASNDSLCCWSRRTGSLLNRLAEPDGSPWFEGIDVMLDPEIEQRAKSLKAATVQFPHRELSNFGDINDANFDSLAVSPAGDSLFVAVNAIARLSGGFLQRHFVLEVEPTSLAFKSAVELPGFVRVIAVSPDGRWLACGGVSGDIAEGRGLVALIDIRQHRIVARREGEFGPVTSLTFDPEQKRLAFSSRNAEVLIWLFDDQIKLAH